MNKLTILMTLFLGIAGLANDGEGYRYYVPLPEKTFSGEWQYLIEAGVQGEGEHRIEVIGYNILGMEMTRYEDIVIDGTGGFTFTPFSNQESKSIAVQSLVFQSDTEIKGHMWVYNDVTGQVNAVSINIDQANRVVIPQIGTNYFVWRSGFSLMGIGEESNSTNLDFRFYDSDGVSRDTELWSNFRHQSFLKKTPYFDVLLGDLDNPVSANWGEVLCQNSNFSLTGYQSFSRVDGSPQTCTFELNEAPKTSGSFALYTVGETSSHWTTFTNPHDFEIVATLTLIYEETLFEEEVESTRIDQAKTELIISPHGRFSGIIGQTWFDEVFSDLTKTPLRFEFEIAEEVGPEDEVIDNSIYAIHFVTDGKDALGASNVQSPGNDSYFWLSGQEQVERTLIIQNTETQPIVVELSISATEGKIVGYNRKELGPSESWIIYEDALRDLFKENTTQSFKFSFTSADGLFTTSMLGLRHTGLALITLPNQVIIAADPE